MATDEQHGVVASAREQASETTDRMKTTASTRVRSELDARTTQVADQITPYAEALRRAGNHLEIEGSGTGGQAATRLADQIQQFSDYLRRSDGDRLLGEVESFARRRPWAAGGIGAAIGFMGARFLKASADTRYSPAQPPYTSNPAAIDMPPASTLPPSDMPISRQADDTTAGGW